MSILLSLVLVAQVLSAIGVIVLVLLQHGKGADMGAAFGSGASGSLFGASGSANFLSRITGALATVFFVSTLALSFLASRKPEAPKSIMDQPATTVPAAPTGVPSLPGAPGSAPGAATAPASTGGVPAAPATAAPGSATGGSADAALQKNGQSGQIPK
ncbi:MAG: preprotein translocase subunit SecG [Burkholderiales bacterium]|nr:preprotein translocase subunit SecG [Burkholderiales bacterium]